MNNSYLISSIWPMYEWKHRGSTHIHGFLWSENTPNIDNLDRMNESNIVATKTFFDTYVISWNP